MTQRISNIYRIVTLPWIYAQIQRILGAQSARARYVHDVIKPFDRMEILDCGCGPASLLPFLSNSIYTGIDLNPSHIAYAKKYYADRGNFFVGDVTQDLPDGNGVYDLVIVSALLHHLDDEEAKKLLARAVELVRPKGRVETIDAVWLPRQNPVAWTLNKLDSGLNIRKAEAYQQLARDLPASVECRIFSDLGRLPYDHFCMTLTRAE